MTSRNLLGLVVVVVLAGMGAWLMSDSPFGGGGLGAAEPGSGPPESPFEKPDRESHPATKGDGTPLVGVAPLEDRSDGTPDEGSAAWVAFERAAESRGVSGRVVSAEGQKPVAGAAISVRLILNEDIQRPQIGDVVAYATSGDDGAFSLHGFQRLGERYAMDVRHRDFASTRILPIDPLVPSTLTRTVVLGTGVSLGGRVTDNKGAPLPEVRVTVMDASTGGSTLSTEGEGEATTDRDGLYEIPRLAPGVKRVVARVEGLSTGERNPFRLTGSVDNVDFRLGAGHSIAGRVVDAGTGMGMAGMAVSASPVGKRTARSVTQPDKPPLIAAHGDTGETDAAGYFRINGLGPGLHVVSVLRGLGQSSVRNARAGDEDVELTVKVRGVVTGTVVEAETGAPVTRFSVALSSGIRPIGTAPALRRRCEDPNGSFSLMDVPPGRHYVSVEAPGYASGQAGPIITGLGERRAGVVVRLEQGSVAHGRVLNSAGAGVAGARVGLMEEVRLEGSSQSGVGAARITVPRRLATSFADGSFLLPNVGNGRYALRVDHPQYASVATEIFTMGHQGDVELRDVVLERAAVIRGVVLDGSGRPDHLAAVRAVPDGWKTARHIPPAATDAEGRFVMEGLGAGSYRLVVIQRRGRQVSSTGAATMLTLAPGDTKTFTLRPE